MADEPWDEREEWWCPLLDKEIEAGLCMDLNYELIHFLKSGAGPVDDFKLRTGKTAEEISKVCESCPNYPLSRADS